MTVTHLNMEDVEPEIVPDFTMQQLLVDVWSFSIIIIDFHQWQGTREIDCNFCQPYEELQRVRRAP